MPLPDPKFNETAPLWFLTVRPGTQQRMDGDYLFALDNWKAAAAGWLEGEIRLRDSSPDPARYTASPFIRPIPQREVWDYDEARGGPYTHSEPVDPNIHLPVLPPYVKPTAPGDGFKQLPDPRDEALFSLLVGIDRKLDRLLGGK